VFLTGDKWAFWLAAQRRRIELTVSPNPRVLEGSSGTPTCDNTPAADGILERSTGRVYKPNSTSTSNYCILCIIEHWNVVLDPLKFLCLRSTGVWLQWPKIILCNIRGLAFLTPSGARATFGVYGWCTGTPILCLLCSESIARECNLHSRQDLLVCSAPLLRLR